MIVLSLEATNRNGLVRCEIFGDEFVSGIKAYSIEEIAKELERRLIARTKDGRFTQIDEVYVDISAYGIVLANELEEHGVMVKRIHTTNIDYWLPINRILEETTDGDSDLWRKSFV